MLAMMAVIVDYTFKLKRIFNFLYSTGWAPQTPQDPR